MLTDIQILNMLPLSPERRQALIAAVITQHMEQKRDSDKSQSPDEPEHDCHSLLRLLSSSSKDRLHRRRHSRHPSSVILKRMMPERHHRSRQIIRCLKFRIIFASGPLSSSLSSIPFVSISGIVVFVECGSPEESCLVVGHTSCHCVFERVHATKEASHHVGSGPWFTGTVREPCLVNFFVVRRHIRKGPCHPLSRRVAAAHTI